MLLFCILALMKLTITSFMVAKFEVIQSLCCIVCRLVTLILGLALLSSLHFCFLCS
jgi:hypothetical protein